MIAELSSPVIDLWDKVVLMPLIGVIDMARSPRIADRSPVAISLHLPVLPVASYFAQPCSTMEHSAESLRQQTPTPGIHTGVDMHFAAWTRQVFLMR